MDRETLHSDPSPSPLLPALLDRSDHPVYHLPVVFFYSAADADADADLEILKSSLSTALASFYPLAGRLSGNSIVDCGDQGVEMFEARAPGADLSEILSSDEPDLDEVKKFLPCSKGQASCCDSEPTVILSVQATVFRCGGIAVGLCVSHKIADGRSLFSFLQAWAAAARGRETAGEQAAAGPEAVRARRAENRGAEGEDGVFGDDAIPGGGGARLAVRIAGAARARAAVATLVLDSRSRTEPPTPIGSFGNRCIAILVGIPRDVVENVASDVTNESANNVLEAEMGAAVEGVDAEYVRRLQGEDGWLRASELTLEEVQKCGGLAEAGFDMNIFSSWLRLPVYEVDFGWGPAAWACTTLLGPSAMVVLPRPPSAGDPQGMEVWASLGEDEMAELQRELDKLVPLNPVHHVGQP
uniref:Salutaridinol 7-O-acetyltransferase-like n=1 Tax=Ananas comosus var. bracteatus TaxID=296719 RepID=A0A6V7Q249_ANACO|nr:unnamed protein product [Ananas comosus var. bracteatus]